jgi:hypothetical protein
LGNGRDDRHLAWGFYLPSITFPFLKGGTTFHIFIANLFYFLFFISALENPPGSSGRRGRNFIDRRHSIGRLTARSTCVKYPSKRDGSRTRERESLQSCVIIPTRRTEFLCVCVCVNILSL